jgi:hypothetical protein
VWYPTDDNFVGCGYEGTSDNIKAVKYGEGCEGCLSDAETDEDDSSLLWLWITLPIVLLIISLGLWYFLCGSKAKTQHDANLLAHATKE